MKLESSLHLRPVHADDSRLLFEWANNPKVREMSLDSNTITWEDHCRWFQETLESDCCKLYIAYTSHKNPVGQIRFNIEHGSAFTDISIDSRYRTKGLGLHLLTSGIKMLGRELPIKKIYAIVKNDNIPSRKIFEQAGFSIQNKNSTASKTLTFELNLSANI